METENILRKFGLFALIFGSLGGIITIFTRAETGFYKNMEFSATNFKLGIAVIISSVFWWILCNWLSEILANSKKKINLLNDIKNQISELEYKSKKI